MNDDPNTPCALTDRHAAGRRIDGQPIRYHRADRRRPPPVKAVIGSIAAVTIGIVGFAALGTGSIRRPTRRSNLGIRPPHVARHQRTPARTTAVRRTSAHAGNADPATVPVTWNDNNVNDTVVAATECIVPTTIPTRRSRTTITTTTVAARLAT
jgi:hypothetical protein